jgi:hypothetical protein
MYMPRRHYRRLLLPPGWVALGFLLLLGCQVLLAHRRQMRVDYIMELPMPIPEEMAAKLSYSPYIKPFAKPLADIKSTTRWSTVSFNGRKLNDFVNGAMAATAIRDIYARATHAAGVKVCFQEGATYGNLMTMLDLMYRLDRHRYWLDIEHSPTAFYVVNKQAIKAKKEAAPTPGYMLLCVSPLPGKYEPPIPVPTQWQVAQRAFTNLWQRAWLPTTLIAVISALSLYRLRRLYRPAR